MTLVNIEVFSLKTLAEKEKVNYGYLRRVVSKFTDDEPKKWRGYTFSRMGDKFWLSYKTDPPDWPITIQLNE
jgi:hypothetical protein